MRTKIIIISIIVALMGMFFLGRGITGNVISQSCCIPPNCDADQNICSFIEENSDALQEKNENIFSGIILIFVSISIITAYRMLYH